MQTIKVRTTPDEMAEMCKIKAMKQFYMDGVDRYSAEQRAAYAAENRPMCGTLNTPGMFAPKSEAIRRADANLRQAMDASAKFLKSIGAKKLTRLHRLEMAGLL